MKMTLAGTRQLPSHWVHSMLDPVVGGLRPIDGVRVLLRHPSTDGARPGEFERQAATACDFYGLPYEWWKPQPTDKTPGRASVYVRDMDMVAASDLVVLFFTPEEAVDGYGGTSHLLEKALEANRHTIAYSVDEENHVEMIGDWRPRTELEGGP